MTNQPQEQYIPGIAAFDYKNCLNLPRDPLPVFRPEITQPDNPFIRYIPLTKGYVAIVDTHLYEWLSRWNWFVTGGKGKLYACTNSAPINGKRKPIYMHVLIMGTSNEDKRKGDHADGNSFNNVGSNLRYVDMRKNAQNRRRGKHNKSGLKGVHWEIEMKAWRVSIHANGKRIPLGYFPLEQKEAAGRAYDAAARKYFGEFACLNFPDDSPAGSGVADQLCSG